MSPRSASIEIQRFVARLGNFCCLGFAFFLSLATRESNASEQPNIILINLDDADRGMLEKAVLAKHFPNIHSIAKKGLTFSNFHVTSPLCGPSRACLLRGQYAHVLNHRTNNAAAHEFTPGFDGDYLSFREQGHADNDFGKWMQAAGYHTAFVGKYINGPFTSKARIHEGWNDFYHSRHGVYFRTPRFTNRYDVLGRHETLHAGQYRTDVEGLDLGRIIRQASRQRPLFVYFAPYGPHSATDESGGMVDAKFKGLWPHLRVPQNTSYNELQNEDKPSIYSQLLRMNQRIRDKVEDLYRQRMLATKSVDIAVGRILRALEQTNRVDNTYIMVTSDNGFLLGHHRLLAKGVSLTQATNVPLIVCGPGVPQNRLARHLTAHIDIAPTLLDLAGAPTQPFFDGKSFKPLLQDPTSVPPRQWRDSFLVENWQNKFFTHHRLAATFVQLRMFDSAYTEWADGSSEYYTLDNDPLELENIASTLPEVQKRIFRARIADHRRAMESPLATIETPSEDFGTISGPAFFLRGVAEDSSGIRRVDLVIREASTNRFWNGNTWQASRTTIQAHLKNPEGILCEWTYRFDPTGKSRAIDSYVVTARAFSQNGKSSDKVGVRRFRFDSFSPSTEIDFAQVTASRRLAIEGTAHDNQRVKRVSLEIRNQQGQFFDRKNWRNDPTSFFMPVDNQGNWSWRSPPFSRGRYRVKVVAQDVAKNVDLHPPVRTLVIE